MARMPVRIVPFTPRGVSEAAEVVKGGGLVVYPTDTVYGLGCDPFDKRAVARLFDTKGRVAKPVPVLCSSLETAGLLVSLDGKALSLARKFWPGALTIVAPVKRGVPFPVDQGSGMVGVRVPASGLCLRLISQCGGFLTGTSANVSGRPSCRTARGASEALGEKVDLVMDGGTRRGRESAVVRVREGVVEVLRSGALVLPGWEDPLRRKKGVNAQSSGF